MSDFEDFIKSGDVKIKEKDEILAKALIKSSEKGERYAKNQAITEESAEHIVADVYDAIRELIEAKLSLLGYKSYSHEATISFLKKFQDFNESDITFLDNLRKTRNSIKYYGREATIEDAEKTLNFMNSILPKLKKLIKNAK